MCYIISSHQYNTLCLCSTCLCPLNSHRSVIHFPINYMNVLQIAEKLFEPIKLFILFFQHQFILVHESFKFTFPNLPDCYPPLFLYLSLLYKPLYPLPPRSTPSTLYPSPEGGVGYSLRIKVYVTVLNIIRDCKLLTVIWC